jgi:hypothetical protein
VARIIESLEFVAVKSILAIGRDVNRETQRDDENQHAKV